LSASLFQGEHGRQGEPRLVGPLRGRGEEGGDRGEKRGKIEEKGMAQRVYKGGGLIRTADVPRRKGGRAEEKASSGKKMLEEGGQNGRGEPMLAA